MPPLPAFLPAGAAAKKSPPISISRFLLFFLEGEGTKKQKFGVKVTEVTKMAWAACVRRLQRAPILWVGLAIVCLVHHADCRTTKRKSRREQSAPRQAQASDGGSCAELEDPDEIWRVGMEVCICTLHT